ncbi:CDP-glucose 4,6-dehydratase [Sinorhizobium terangae]|uniref:CDP-glucose 4,6-dehydratase n=1 Tax=Sinorhizobium terangae TaxID=110322 RepID=A0A6N7LE69_SINTE|nr:CDP-glucose 4,6-dehydratase [Sinorhizobium terangae]MBB4186318.1 CDP-glucose 4,6-dehydratase [Sinorhizobium terangae]MQX15926.1 CDP-glucose 4,6-dehydratase [Sinorhizobium terangae]
MNETDLSQILRGRRVLVTGHTGFKGGWLSLWLRRLGAHVVGIALPAVAPSFCSAVDLEGLVDGRVGDIRSEAGFGESIGGQDFDLVIHMAAQAVVRASYEMPVDTYMTNVIGTAVVLDAARRMPSLRGIVVVTSDKCYENREWVWGYRESDPMGGRDPYSSSKGCAELVAAAYRSSFFSDPGGPQLATVRAGNVIGGGDWGADRLIPDLVRAAETGIPARLRNPKNVRPWQHVLEPLRGYLMLAAGLVDAGARFAGGWNFGPEKDATVNVGALAELVVSQWGGRPPEYIAERRVDEPAESVVLRLDSTKSHVELGWKPLLRLDEAVAMTVAWHRRYMEDPTDMRRFSQQQLDGYAADWGRAA